MNKGIWKLKALELGARNGIIFGSLFELAYRSYYRWSSSPIDMSSETCCPSVIGYPFPWWYIPLVSVVFASLASLLVHRCLSRRIESTILLWQAVGLLAFITYTGYEVVRNYWHFARSQPGGLGADYWKEIVLVPLLKSRLSLLLPMAIGYNVIFALALGRAWRASRGGAG